MEGLARASTSGASRRFNLATAERQPWFSTGLSATGGCRPCTTGDTGVDKSHLCHLSVSDAIHRLVPIVDELHACNFARQTHWVETTKPTAIRPMPISRFQLPRSCMYGMSLPAT